MCTLFVFVTDIGTALDQIDDKGDEYPRVDECTGIVVMNNQIETQVRSCTYV